MHRREVQRAAEETERQNLQQQYEHERQRMAELCASLREELENEQHSAASILSQSEEEESARRQERIKHLQAQIGDILFEAIRDLQR